MTTEKQNHDYANRIWVVTSNRQISFEYNDVLSSEQSIQLQNLLARTAFEMDRLVSGTEAASPMQPQPPQGVM